MLQTRYRLIAMCMLALACWQGCAQAELRPGEPAGRQASSYIEGELIVKFKPGMVDRDAYEAGQAREDLLPPGVRKVLETQRLSLKGMQALYPRRQKPDPARAEYGFDHVYKLAFQSDSESVAIPAVIQALSDTGEIEYAEPNFIAHTQKGSAEQSPSVP